MNQPVRPLQDQRPDSGDQWGSARTRAAAIIDSTPPAAAPARAGAGVGPRHQRGFTLIELMLVMAVAGILSGVAYPSFMGQLQKIRRADALVSMLQIQVAQERWRSNNTSYGSLAQIGVAVASSAGHYAIQVSAPSELAYEVLASAQGTQAHDAPCRYLRLRAEGGNLVQSSGPDTDTNNGAGSNRQCWGV